MKDYKFSIISDGSCDLPDEIVLESEIDVVPFSVSFDGNIYLREKVDIDVPSFYQKLIDEPTVFPKTTMPSVDAFVSVFEKEILKGKPIICVCITTKFSGSYNSAISAKKICLEKYPNASIEVIDSMINTGLQGIYVLEIVRMRNDGLSFEEAVLKANELKKTGRIYFTVGNLEYLRRGGRIGKLIGLVGATFKIKPIIVLHDGEIFSEGLSFSRKKSFLKAANTCLEYFSKTKENIDDYRFITGYGYDREEGIMFHNKFSEMINRNDVMLIQIGATIGVHTGPHPLGIGFIKKYENL